jgi:threonine aldolase
MNRFFASDNCSPVHPEIMKALAAVPTDHVHSYGEDPVTAASIETIKDLFAESHESRSEATWSDALKAASNSYMHRQASVCYVFTGTAANIVCIASLLHPGQSVACGHHAHINEDEGGALEASTGIKIRHVESRQGKLSIPVLEPLLHELGNVHRSQPAMVSLSQTTELGTMYTPAELLAISDWSHEHGMFVHMDGARIANAVAADVIAAHPDWRSIGPARLVAIAEAVLRRHTVEAGVDALSLGGTKNGMLCGEGVVFFTDPGKIGVTRDGWPSLDLSLSLAGRRAPFVRKHHMQLASKMRYISAQMAALYGSDLWIRNALQANAMAARLSAGIEAIAERYQGGPASAPTAGAWADSPASGPLPRLMYPAPANALFVQLPAHIVQELQDEHYFYVNDVPRSVVRLMCTWDTEEADIDRFLASLEGLMARHS